MISLDPLLHHFAPFLLVLFRVLGLFVFTPILTSSTLPRQVRVVVALSFAAAIYPFVPAGSINPVELDLIPLAGLMFTEVMIGVSIGLMVQLPLLALQMGGFIMGYQMGLALAQSYNPEMDAQSSAVGQLLFLAGAMAFISLGGLEAVFLAMAESFRTLPPGAFAADIMPTELFVDMLTAAFEFALRIAAPVLGVLSLILVSMGIVMKTMPQINIMSVGFSFKIMSGLAGLTAVLFVINTVANDDITNTMLTIHEWVASLSGKGVPGG